MIIILIRTSMRDRGVMEIIITIILTVMGNYPHEDYDNADDNANDGHDHEDDDDEDDDDNDDNENGHGDGDVDVDVDVDGDGDGDGDDDGDNGNYGNDQHEEISFEGKYAGFKPCPKGKCLTIKHNQLNNVW